MSIYIEHVQSVGASNFNLIRLCSSLFQEIKKHWHKTIKKKFHIYFKKNEITEYSICMYFNKHKLLLQ